MHPSRSAREQALARSRLALHIGGIPFEDCRFASADFAEVRKTTPLDHVPTDLIATVVPKLAAYVQRVVRRPAAVARIGMRSLLCSPPACRARRFWRPC